MQNTTKASSTLTSTSRRRLYGRPERGQRCGEHQDVLHPLPWADRLDEPGGEVLRRARDRTCRFFAHLRCALCRTLSRDAHALLQPGRRRRRPLRDDRPDRHAGEHIARVVHAEHQAGQRHRRHQHHGQGQAGGPGQQHRRGGGGRGVRRREAQPARRADVDRDRRVVRAFAPTTRLITHGGGVGDERARRPRPAMPAAARAAAARRAPRRRPSRGCAHRNATVPARRPAHRAGRPAPTARPPARLPRRAGSSAIGRRRFQDSTVSHFCLLVSAGSASR